MKKLILSAACTLCFIGYAAGQKAESTVKPVAAKEEVKKTDSKGKKESNKVPNKKVANSESEIKLVLPAVVADSTADVPKVKGDQRRRR